MSSAPAGSLLGWGLAARAAGAVVVLGYLLGLVRGPVVAVAGGLALVTLGRCASAKGRDDLVLGGALAVIAGGLTVGALRWETLDLARLRGAQAVLGPTVLVDPVTAATAAWIAAAAGVAALAVWLSTARRADDEVGGRLVLGLWVAEGALAAFALVTAFWGASASRGSFGGAGGVLAVVEWAVAVAVVTGAAVAGAVYLRRVPAWRGRIVAAAGAAVVAAAALVTAGS
ncbi:MAG TPA: hypothetical protein VHN37_09580 [Actinomycetota bacterium]|nr:hypothetical protein [Actinomycetota bacterium]